MRLCCGESSSAAFRPRRRLALVAGSGHCLRALADPDRGCLRRLRSGRGRPAIIAVESGIAGVFVVLAAIGVTGPA